jgi:hypothetical protein
MKVVLASSDASSAIQAVLALAVFVNALFESRWLHGVSDTRESQVVSVVSTAR